MKDTLNYYNQKAKEFAADTSFVEFTEIQDIFRSFLSEGSKILDFGCGAGRDTKYFLSRGYDVEAIDGSEELCKIASEFAGIEVRNMMFEELNCLGEYDGIWACASLLHVAKCELADILKKMAVATKDNGVVYASFKYGDFEGVRNGRYFTYFTENSFKEMLENVPELIIEKLWISKDVRAERGEEQWLNLILRKTVVD